MSLTPLTYSTSTPSLRKGALFLLLADAVQGWSATNVDCGVGNYINTSGRCQACTKRTDSYCTTCKKVCIVSNCNSSRSGSTESCPIGFSPTGKYMKSGHIGCVSWQWRYQCCRYEEQDDSCKLENTNVLEEAKKYTDLVGRQCGIDYDLLGCGHVFFATGCRQQRKLSVFSYSDGDSIYFMLHAYNYKIKSYVNRIGFKYEGPNGELCSRMFVPNMYQSAYFADEDVECGGDTIRAWGYNEVHSSINRSGNKINVEWTREGSDKSDGTPSTKKYAFDARLFIGPFKKSLLRDRLIEGKGFQFWAKFYKKVGNGSLWVYKSNEYTAENQKCVSNVEGDVGPPEPPTNGH